MKHAVTRKKGTGIRARGIYLPYHPHIAYSFAAFLPCRSVFHPWLVNNRPLERLVAPRSTFPAAVATPAATISTSVAAIAAAVTAAVTTATTAAVSATTTAVTTPSATTAAAGGSLASFIHNERPPIAVASVEASDCRLGVGVACHLHESETARA